MKTAKSFSFDRDYLRRCKHSSPEQKFKWLQDAVDFAFAKKTKVAKR